MVSVTFSVGLQSGTIGGGGNVALQCVDGILPDVIFEPVDVEGRKIPGNWSLQFRDNKKRIAVYLARPDVPNPEADAKPNRKIEAS